MVYKKGQCLGKNNPFYGKHHTDETKQRLRERALEQFKNGIPEETRKKISEANKGKVRSEATRIKIGLVQRGHIVTEETRKKISKSKKGKYLSEEHKAKISESLKGNTRRKGKPTSEETKRRLSESLKGNTNSKGNCPNEETRRKMSLIHKGQVPWIKGKHHTKEAREKLRLNHMGHIVPDDVRKKISESNKGKITSDETRKKISDAHIDWDFYNEHGCLKRNYPYNDCFTEEFKDEIRALYDNKCVVTGMTNEEHKAKYGKSLHVHHWMYNKDETDPFYFVPVTMEINAMANSNKSEWQEMFWHIAEDKYCELIQ